MRRATPPPDPGDDEPTRVAPAGGGARGGAPAPMPASAPAPLDPPPAAPAVRVVSMKLPTAAAPRPPVVPAAAPREVKLRPLSEVSGRHAVAPGALGYLAPPRAGGAPRGPAGRLRALAGIALAVAIAAAVAAAIWLVGHR